MQTSDLGAELTAVQAAAALHVHIRTVHRLVVDGTLTPSVKLPGRTGAYYFSPSVVDALVSQRAAS